MSALEIIEPPCERTNKNAGRCNGGFCNGNKAGWREAQIMGHPVAFLCRDCAGQWKESWGELASSREGRADVHERHQDLGWPHDQERQGVVGGECDEDRIR